MIPFTLSSEDGTRRIEDFRQLLQLGMALLSICCMVLLGFADDVLGKLIHFQRMDPHCTRITNLNGGLVPLIGD